MRARYFFPLLLLPLSVYGEDVSKISTLSVHGEAVTKIAPDQADFSVTITGDNKSLEAAKQESDEKLKKILAVAANYGVRKEDIQTGYNEVQPQYDYNNNVTTQTDVYNGTISFVFDATELSQDKVDSLVEALQKADLSNIGTNHHNEKTQITASYNDKNPDAKALHDNMKKKEAEILAIAASAGIEKNKINSNSFENKGKENRVERPKQQISSYRSTATINFIVKDKDKVTAFINELSKQDVENIGNVNFGISDAAQKKASAEALLDAFKDANAKAQRLAQAAGVTLDRPVQIDEGGGTQINYPRPPRPMFMKAAMGGMEAAAAPAPADLPSGLIEIQQNVNVTYQLK